MVSRTVLAFELDHPGSRFLFAIRGDRSEQERTVASYFISVMSAFVMFFIMAILAQSLEVVEAVCDRRILPVLLIEIGLVMDDPCRFVYPFGFASLTKVIDLLEICFTASLPFG